MIFGRVWFVLSSPNLADISLSTSATLCLSLLSHSLVYQLLKILTWKSIKKGIEQRSTTLIMLDKIVRVGNL